MSVKTVTIALVKHSIHKCYAAKMLQVASDNFNKGLTEMNNGTKYLIINCDKFAAVAFFLKKNMFLIVLKQKACLFKKFVSK